MSKQAQWRNSRQVLERIFIKGTLVLKTPASFGNGDAVGTTDMPLLFDALDGKSPLLTGASIAGALRNYLRDYQKGYAWEERRASREKSSAELLFGHLDDAFIDETGNQKKSAVESWLFVDDARGAFPDGNAVTELRDGVAIDAATHTVEEDDRGGHKFDFELLPAGTIFPLSFEFWKTAENQALLPALATVLRGLEQGEIGLGMRKNRGLGECLVTQWQVCRYKMDEPAGLINWLKRDGKANVSTGEKIVDLLGVQIERDERRSFTIDAHFALRGSILIRSEGSETDAADMVHLRSWREGREQPILPGTSLAGVIRGRALRIANTVLGLERGRCLVDEMFGRRIGSHLDQPSSSQVIVRETAIEGGVDGLIQSRVKIDRFTGGSFPQALFTQQPHWGKGKDKQINIHLELRRLHDGTDTDFLAKAGLLLLTLKDLWTGDLAVGGESSVGRGRLHGLRAALSSGCSTWEIVQGSTALEIRNSESDSEFLEECVQAFRNWEMPLANEGQVKK